jgi:histidine phosphotransferase ChpT
MEMPVDLRVLEMLMSRLCHDLVSPVGAVKSGLELFTEFGDDADGQTMALINGSAEQAAQKLQFFRLAYGQAGSQREAFKLAEAVNLLTATCGNQRTSIVSAGDAVVSGAGNGKLLLNMALVVAEALPRGGTITVAAAADALRATAQGVGARLDPAMVDALGLGVSVEALSPKTVQGYFTGLLVRRADGELSYAEDGPDRVTLSVATKR